MAALSYNPSLLCSVFPSNSSIMMSGSLEKGDFNTSTSALFPYSFPSGHFQEIPIQVVDAQGITDPNTQMNTPTTQMITPTKKKRKCRDGSCLSLAISKDSNSNRGKGKKQRKCNSCNSDEAENEKIGGEKNHKKGIEVAQNGCVYVRARRGEATDRHSLAERVRREKISERLNLLQSLVPGCDKMCSKALMLDEIISYVQSLQRQVEFLSMKLSYTNLMIHDSGRDISSMARPEKVSPLVSPLAQAEITAPLATAITCPPTDTSVSNFLDNCDLLWGY